MVLHSQFSRFRWRQFRAIASHPAVLTIGEIVASTRCLSRHQNRLAALMIAGVLRKAWKCECDEDEYPQREVFLDYEPVYLDWRLVLGRVARLKGRQVWVVFRTTASYGRRRAIPAAGALNWGAS